MHCMAHIEAINCALARIGKFSIESREKVVSTCVRWTVLGLIGWRWYFQTSLSGKDLNLFLSELLEMIVSQLL